MKKICNIVKILMIAIMMISLTTSVFAALSPADVSGADDTSSSFNSIGGKIIGGLKAVGSIAAIAILVVLGLKYMMGSTEEKAEYKKTMIPYVVGAVFIFAAANIASMVYEFADGI